MTISRRSLLGAAALGSGSILAAGSSAQAAPPQPVLPRAGVKAPRLVPGDRVRVVATAGIPDTRLARGIQILQSFGLVVETGAHLYDKYGYLAGTDEARLADLNAAFTDPGIKGVFAARGGYGTQRIIDGFDLRAVRRNPRVFVGFSDLTVLSGRLWQAARQVSFYGPMINWTDSRTGPVEIESLRAAIMTTDPIVLTPDPAEPSSLVTVAGTATGTLLGGNLTMLQTSIGTPDLPDLRGAILLFEDTDDRRTATTACSPTCCAPAHCGTSPASPSASSPTHPSPPANGRRRRQCSTGWALSAYPSSAVSGSVTATASSPCPWAPPRRSTSQRQP